jgi:uncharacterized protein
MLRRRLLLLLAAAPAGCASPNPVLYVLAPIPGTSVAGSGVVATNLAGTSRSRTSVAGTGVAGTPASGGRQPGAPASVELREIGLARYLERSQIVRSSEGYRLDVLSNEWWGEPLGAMLSRVLVQELAQRLPGSTVFGETGAITINPAATVAVNIQRLDGDATGAAVLIAQIEVSGSSTGTRDVHLTVAATAPGTAGLVEALSQAIAQLADTIAAMLRGP